MLTSTSNSSQIDLYFQNGSSSTMDTFLFNISNSTNLSSKIACINGVPRIPTPGTVPFYVGVYVLPAVYAVGIIGNILNLIVLNSRNMRTKTGIFLSAMAGTDLAFFIVMALFNLHVYDTLAESETFMKVYIKGKMTLMTLANWFSAASIWIAVAVTVERLIAISRPFQARFFWQTRRIVILLSCIYLFSFYLFLHNWFWMWPTWKPLCGIPGGRVYGLATIKPIHSPLLYKYVLISQYLAIVCTVIAPLLLLIILNSLLLYFLRKNRRDVLSSLVPSDEAENGHVKHTKNSRSTSIGSVTLRQRHTEAKVAFMVSIIVVSFIVFLSPSAVLYIWETIGIIALKLPRPSWLPMAAYISNQLVIINKSMNFVLYCAVGKQFRRNLIHLIRKRMGLRRYSNGTRNTSKSKSKTENILLNVLTYNGTGQGQMMDRCRLLEERNIKKGSLPAVYSMSKRTCGMEPDGKELGKIQMSQCALRNVNRRRSCEQTGSLTVNGRTRRTVGDNKEGTRLLSMSNGRK